LGNGTQAARISKLVEDGDNEHFIPVSFIDIPDRTIRSRSETLDWSAIDTDGLLEMGYRLGASEIVVAVDDRRGLPVRQLLHCKLAGIKVTDFLDFWERETRTVDLDALKPSWLFYSDGFRCGPVDEFLKRAFDIVVSSSLLAFTLPLLVLTACLIKLESPGPILYRQERVGTHVLRRRSGQSHSLLRRAPLGQARDHRLGPNQFSLRRLDRGRPPQAGL